MLDKIPEAIFEQTVQSIAAAIYSQPKLAGLREPVEKILYRDNFKHLTRRAFQNFLEKKQDKLPKILDDAFIRHEVTQRLLAAYIRDGNADAVTQIAHRYAEYAGESVTAVQTALNEYLPELRAVLIEDEIYGRIILAQDMSAILNELRDLRQANDSNFGDIKDQLDFIISILIEFVVKPPSPFANISAALSGTLYTQPGAVRNEQVPSMKQLVGRETIQKEIFDALSASGRVLIQGFGGEGKTALAAVLADDWLRANKGAVLWLRAGSAGAAALAEALAATFKAQEIIAKAPDEKSKLGLLKQILPQTPVTLLVLDDCWDGTALLAVVQAGIPGNIAVLATSRQVHEMPTVIEIPKLDETAALDLLKTHAENQIDKLAAAKELCQAVYGLPFAIEIAGINMKVNKWSASEMLAKVQAERLTLSKKWVEAGRENIAALIAASVNALPETAQNVFDAWGAFFVPTITPLLMMLYFVGEPEVSDEMLLQVRAIPEIPQDISNDELRKLLQASILQNLDSKPADAALQTLQQHGLATRIPPTENAVAHYRLHDLAYEYTGKNAHDEMRNRAVEACLRYTDRYKSPSLQNFAALRPELDQFMAAANFAMQQGRYAQVEQFSDMLYVGSGTGGFLALSGLYEKSFKLLEQARDAAKAAGNRHNEGNALGNLGIAYRNLGDYQQAIKYHEQALKISREIGDKRGEGNALGNLGNAYAALGDYQQAIKYHEQALDISREIGDRRGEGNRLGNLGNAYAALGDYQKAIKYHEQALDISREIGNKSAVGSILGNLGIAYADLGDYQQAIKYHEQALVIRREIGDRRGEAHEF
jgi:tetratricopeptide (TPR) repeat protein